MKVIEAVFALVIVGSLFAGGLMVACAMCWAAYAGWRALVERFTPGGDRR